MLVVPLASCTQISRLARGGLENERDPLAVGIDVESLSLSRHSACLLASESDAGWSRTNNDNEVIDHVLQIPKGIKI